MTAIYQSYQPSILPREVHPHVRAKVDEAEVAGLPEGAWDSHVHVVDEDKFPLHPEHPYRPRKADLHDLLTFEKNLGTAHVCLIAFSVYHTDNSSLLDALRRLNGRGRGIVCIDPESITDAELDEMHRLGVRGVRINLRTRGQTLDAEAYQLVLSNYARRIKKYRWSIQLYVALDQIALLAKVIPELGVTVIFDHVGSPDSSAPPRLQKGCREFMTLLKSGMVYTKLSGTYRFPTTPELDDYIREILRVAPDRVVWASDWPHSGGTEANPGGDRDKVQDYRKIDDQAWIEKCKILCGNDPELIRKIWRDNPRRLWDYQRDD